MAFLLDIVILLEKIMTRTPAPPYSSSTICYGNGSSSDCGGGHQNEKSRSTASTATASIIPQHSLQNMRAGLSPSELRSIHDDILWAERQKKVQSHEHIKYPLV